MRIILCFLHQSNCCRKWEALASNFRHIWMCIKSNLSTFFRKRRQLLSICSDFVQFDHFSLKWSKQSIKCVENRIEASSFLPSVKARPNCVLKSQFSFIEFARQSFLSNSVASIIARKSEQLSSVPHTHCCGIWSVVESAFSCLDPKDLLSDLSRLCQLGNFIDG